jgi:hypothetical protein
MKPRAMILVVMSLTIILVTLVIIVFGKARKSPSNSYFNEWTPGKGCTQIASLEYHMNGCFGEGREKFILYTKDGVLFTCYLFGRTKRIFEISDLQKEAFLHFIAELKTLTDGCISTTSENYIVNFNGEDIKRGNGPCDWEGYRDLRQTLGLQPGVPAF